MQLSIVESLAEIPAQEWDALGGVHDFSQGHPFTKHAFLHLLEKSGSVGANQQRHSGWHALHLLLHTDDKKLVGACPCYLKEHSYGEYIFDWSWAEAVQRSGRAYYPKLVVGVPFTPATGPRLLVLTGVPPQEKQNIQDLLAQGLKQIAQQIAASSVHVLFCLDNELAVFEKAGFFRRATHQYHWRNQENSYVDFDAFLEKMRSKNRKQIRKERRAIQESGLHIELVQQDALKKEDFQKLYELYRSTCGRKWGEAYLSADFFHGLAFSGGKDALFGLARNKKGEIKSMALSFIQQGSQNAIYGRYWGTSTEQEQLHFELCYYQLLEYAIENNCVLVEAGAQGEHKIKRGFLPVVTHSAHYFLEPHLQQIFSEAIRQERYEIEQQVSAGFIRGPFKEKYAPTHLLRAGNPISCK